MCSLLVLGKDREGFCLFLAGTVSRHCLSLVVVEIAAPSGVWSSFVLMGVLQDGSTGLT